MRTCVAAAAILVVTSLASGASVLVESTFDSDADGWTLLGGPYTTWQGAGGNPGGYIHFERGANWMRAPAGFLGDWTDLGVTSLAHDVKVAGDQSAMFYVTVSGPGGGVIHWTWLNPGTGWLSLTVPLSSSEWEVQTGSWDAVLSDVTQVGIGLYYIPSYIGDMGPLFDAGIDNVRLYAGEVIPVPGALLLGGIGAGLTGWLRRRRVF